MPGHRAEAEAFILKNIHEMLPDGANTKLYKEKFSKMTDDEFEQFIEDLESGKINLSVVTPNFSKTKIDLSRNLALAEKLGHRFFQKINIPAQNGLPAYQTPIEYMVVHLPLRRQAQLLEKKISIPEDNNTVDDITGQPTGDSKGSKISYPETQVLAALGLDEALEELLKYRGGDERGFAAMNTMISRTGGVSLKAVAPYASGVKSVSALQAFLLGMQLKSNL